jgi:hypothetical protein
MASPGHLFRFVNIHLSSQISVLGFQIDRSIFHRQISDIHTMGSEGLVYGDFVKPLKLLARLLKRGWLMLIPESRMKMLTPKPACEERN